MGEGVVEKFQEQWKYDPKVPPPTIKIRRVFGPLFDVQI